jgi:hypothetical protein
LVSSTHARVGRDRPDRDSAICLSLGDALPRLDELRTFENSPSWSGTGCKGPDLWLKSGKTESGFCRSEKIRPPALAALFARLEKNVPPHLEPWSATHYVVDFANIRRKNGVEEEGVPLTWPSTLPYPKIQGSGASIGAVVVEARLLPEVKRYAAADPSAQIRWEPMLPGIDDRWQR